MRAWYGTGKICARLLARNEIGVAYQPLSTMQDGHLLRSKLVALQHPSALWCSDSFIQVAEQSG